MHPALRGLLLGLVVGGALAVGCTYDFDAPFEHSDNGQGASAGGMAGAGGTTTTTTTTTTTSGSGGGPIGGGGTGGGGALGGGGSGGGGPSEICDNGTDDDGDGDVDCADSQCTTVACVPPVPSLWDGLWAMELQPSSVALDACAATWANSDEENHNPSGTAQCTPCGCGSATVPCSIATTDSHPSGGCPANVEATLVPQGEGMCTSFSVNDLDSLSGDAVVVSGTGSCPDSGGDENNSPPTWSHHVRLCSDPTLGGGCTGSDLCAPVATGDFAVCISRNGNRTCPSGFPDKTVLYPEFTDNRSCSTCSCQPLNPQCTASTDIWYNSSNCSGNADDTVDNDGSSCVSPMHNLINGSLLYTSQGSASGCQASGGQPSGSVQPDGTTTFCCLPSN